MRNGFMTSRPGEKDMGVTLPNGRCSMKKLNRILITTAGLLVLTVLLVGIKGLQIRRMVANAENMAPPPETVTVSEVAAQEWETVLTAVGSLQAVQGVLVTSELPGKVTKIGFQSGDKAESGRLLLQQDISAESAELRAAESDLELTRKNYERGRRLLPQNVVSRSSVDNQKAAFEKATARLDNVKAAIAKKTIKAPFSGRLGIRQVNLGETLAPGRPVVSLQTLDPIYVNFQFPQYRMNLLKKGLPVRITTEIRKDRKIEGVITAINSEVDHQTRNIRVQATLKNPDEELRPGMYATVEVVLPEEQNVLTIPATAVNYAPYSDSVFVVEEKTDEKGKTARMVRQQFVQLGDKRGDFVAVLSGLKSGEKVVSTGVFKLRNGQPVEVDNTLAPKFQRESRPDNA